MESSIFESKELLEVIDLLLNPLQQKEMTIVDIDDIILHSRIETRVKRKLAQKGKELQCQATTATM